MAAVVAELAQLAEEDRRVLVYGESGAGVGWLCRWAHQTSRRRLGPFVVVHLGAVSRAEHESVVFGGGSNPGAIEQATGGTLILRCIEELARSLRDRLLSAAADPRLVATSYSNGARAPMATHDAEFLSSFGSVVEVPPLRARSEDIAELGKALWQRIAEENARTPPPLTDEQLSALVRHDWPGNVRELRNVLEIAQLRWATLGGMQPFHLGVPPGGSS
ncbi:MAG: sigma 54-interacting transcriptional regulator [Deltaproteobacteria bacterium]|nr:sigma 54-interacting transcriptional regulator [Deltaproteobacteria bacterium]